MLTLEDVRAIHDKPLFSLLDEARTAHKRTFAENEVQLATLLSVKTGGCGEDCAYCPQSSHHDTFVEPEKTVAVAQVVESARRAKDAGSTRFCMGWAWREIKDGPAFDNMLEMVRAVKSAGMEACVTAGMLNEQQAARLKEAGLDAYNHNLDTSRENYKSIIKTRTFDDRLATLKRVSDAGISVCTGGIIGMGETIDDRCRMLLTLATLDPQPESVPINALVPVPGTPLENMPPVEPIEMVRMIATARLVAAGAGVDALAVLLCGGVACAIARRVGSATTSERSLLLGPMVGSVAGTAAPIGLLGLFLTFLKVGAVVFGSGYVLLAFLRADLVDRLHWLTEQQLLDAVAVGQVTPGPVFTTATFIGYVIAGVPGAIVATIGIFLPGFVLVAVTRPLIARVRRSPIAAAFLDGVNVASVALMAIVTVQLARAAMVDIPTVLIALVGAVLLVRWKVNSTWLVVGGALVGLVAHHG